MGYQPPRKEIACGTDPGYHLHRRRKEPACGDCREAHAKANPRNRKDVKSPGIGRGKYERTLKPIEHGTDAGYMAHFRRGDLPACRPCIDAHSARGVERRAERKAREAAAAAERRTLKVRIDMTAALFAEMYFSADPALSAKIDEALGRKRVDALIAMADQEEDAA